MAILIPSARIYSIENSKIVDNNIEKVEFDCSKVVANNQENVVVNSSSHTSPFAFGTATSQLAYNYAVAYISMTPQYCRGLEIVVPRQQKTQYVQSIFHGKDEEDNPQIKAVIHYEKKVAPATAQHTYHTDQLSNLQIGVFGSPESLVTDKPISPQTSFTHSEIKPNFGPQDVTTSIPFEDESTIGSPTYRGFATVFSLEFDLLVGYEVLTLGGVDGGLLTGSVERYTAKKVEISVYGNTIGVSLEQEVVKVPDNSSQKSLSISNNELLQKDYTHGTTNALKYFGGKVLDEYRNGKETFTIRCSVNDYYEYDPNTDDKKGALAISIKNDNLPMTFNMYDRVVPMVATAIGADRPLSRYKDGTPKVFRILKRTISNKGIIFQEIHGQEVSQKQTTETTSSFFITWSRSGFTYTDTYYFNEGMTWQEWVNSSYNTDGFAIAKLGANKDKIVKTIDNQNHKVVYLNGNEQTDIVYANKIQANTIYELLPIMEII